MQALIIQVKIFGLEKIIKIYNICLKFICFSSLINNFKVNLMLFASLYLYIYLISLKQKLKTEQKLDLKQKF